MMRNSQFLRQEQVGHEGGVAFRLARIGKVCRGSGTVRQEQARQEEYEQVCVGRDYYELEVRRQDRNR